MDIESIAKNFKSNILVYTLGCYGFGLLYNVIFYRYFGIPIIYYITLQDMLLFSISTLFYTIIICAAYELFFLVTIGVYINKIINRFTKSEKSVNESYALFTNYFTSFLLIIFYPIIFYLSLPIETIFVFFIFIITVSWRSIGIRHELNFNKAVLSISKVLVFILFTFYLINTSASLYPENKKHHIISFITSSGELIDTSLNENLVYIGETSTSIFLYNKSEKNSTVFSKSGLSKIDYTKF